MSKKKLDQLFKLFAGDFIQLVLDKDLETSVQNEESITRQKSPIVMEGYLVDEDDVYLFLGQEPDQINQAVKKEYIIHIEIASEEEVVSEIDKLLLTGKIPNPEEFN